MPVIYYLAYGSNLHPFRLGERLSWCKEVGVVELTGSRLAFHKRGSDGSAKCNLVFTANEADSVFTALFAIRSTDKPLLDRIEGEGYSTSSFNVEYNQQHYSAFAYVAQSSHVDDALMPYHWYRDLVHLGARYHCFPEDYVAAISDVYAIADPHPQRRAKHEELVQRIATHLPGGSTPGALTGFSL